MTNGTARTVRELFTGRKYGLDFYQREYHIFDAPSSAAVHVLGRNSWNGWDWWTVEEGDSRVKLSRIREEFLSQKQSAI
jgi:hypothetical protein